MSNYGLVKRESLKERNAHPLIAFRKAMNACVHTVFEKQQQRQPGERVLDLGCGNGGALPKLFRLAQQHYDGIDMDASRVDECRHRLQTMGFVRSNVVQGNVEDTSVWDMHFPLAAYDVIYCGFMIHYVHDVPALFQRIESRLKPNGLLCIVYPNFDVIQTLFNNDIHNRPEWSNSICRIALETQRTYRFSLGDRVQNEVEFATSTYDLSHAATNLKVVESHNLITYHDPASSLHLNADQLQVLALYGVLVFQKPEH